MIYKHYLWAKVHGEAKKLARCPLNRAQSYASSSCAVKATLAIV